MMLKRLGYKKILGDMNNYRELVFENLFCVNNF